MCSSIPSRICITHLPIIRRIVRVILRKPSVAVASCSALVVGLFVWSGELGLEDDAATHKQQVLDRTSKGPVVVRREAETLLPRSERCGRVYDSMGYLVVDAEVTPVGGVGQRTDLDGRFAIELIEQHTSDLLVEASGRRSEWLRTSAVAPEPMAVRLEPAAPWDIAPIQPLPAPLLRGEGEVFGPDGSPLSNAYVNVLGTGCWGRTDATGRVEIPLPRTRATFVVYVAATPDYAGGFAARSESFLAPRGHGIVPLPRMVAQLAGSIRGTVRDASGAPVSGLPVEVRGAGSVRQVTTSAGGAFLVEGLLPEDYVVEPFAYLGQVSEPMDVRVDRAVVPCDLQLAKTKETSLVVVDENGRAAPGVWVATSFHGVRRGVVQADLGGRVSLPLAGAAQFEVRTAVDFAACSVRRLEIDVDQPKLVITQP